MTLKAEHCELLRRLTLNDERALTEAVSGHGTGKETLIDPRTGALVKLAGLVALDAEVASLQVARDAVYATGAGDEEIVDTVITVSPIVGSSRIAAIIPRLLMAMSSG